MTKAAKTKAKTELEKVQLRDKGASNDTTDERTDDPAFEEKVDVQGDTYFQKKNENEVENPQVGTTYKWPDQVPREDEIVIAARGSNPFIAMYRRQERDGPKGAFYSQPNRNAEWSVLEGAVDVWSPMPTLSLPADDKRKAA